jgi:lysophospholipase L1-like esterase
MPPPRQPSPAARLAARTLLLVAALLVAPLPARPAPPAAPAAPAAPGATNALPFEKEILAYEAADRTNPPPRGAVLFIGSSSIRLWKSLPADFPRHTVINRGFGGSQIADSVRYTPRLILPHRPRLVVLYAGGNDINAGKSPEQVAADYRAFVQGVHTALPETRIAFISIAPNPARWKQVDRVRAANALIEAHTRTDPRLRWIDVFPHMLGPDGLPKPDIFVQDRLHMNTNGYRLWAGVVAPYLEPASK